MQLLKFQKKKHVVKKKKKRDQTASGASGSEASEASSAPASDERPQSNSRQEQPVELAEHEAKLKKKKKDTEDVSQADTDHDAPSIHSDFGSPIPFEVKKKQL